MKRFIVSIKCKPFFLSKGQYCVFTILVYVRENPILFRVDEFELQNDNLAEKAELNFDFYLNHDKLIATAKDIELEFNNLLEFPLKLVNNYLNNISIAFAD